MRISVSLLTTAPGYKTGTVSPQASRSATRTSRYIRAVAYAAAIVLSVAACDRHAPNTRPPSDTSTSTDVPSYSSTSSATHPPTTRPTSAASPADPTAAAAVAAFTHYITATYNAQRAPRKPGQSYKPEADFTDYSFDPIRTQENAYISSLATSGEAFRGTSPQPRVKLVSADPGRQPYPTAALTNCPTPAPTWVAYETKTGKPVAYTKANVPPPYLATVTVIFYEGHWGVRKISVDTGRTCSA